MLAPGGRARTTTTDRSSYLLVTMELFTYTFFQHALLGGTAMAILAGLIGPLVVQSRQAIASDMFAHVSLAGVGGALLLSVTPWWGALPTLLVVSTLLWYLRGREEYSADALAMFFLSGGLALALAFVHVARDQQFSFESYLFGSILTLSASEVMVMFVLTVLVVVVVSVFWYPLIGATHTPRYVLPYSVRPRVVELGFYWLLALVVWVGIKTIGGLLIGALLVVPVLTARGFVSSFRGLTLATIAVSLGAVWAGLLLAVRVDLPPSSLIIFALIAAFVLQLLIRFGSAWFERKQI